MSEQEDSTSALVSKGPCASCGSSDACALYDDGHTHCFVCQAHTNGDATSATPRARNRMTADLIEGDVLPLASRGISAETCQKYGYRCGRGPGGKNVQIATYRDASGDIVAQHTRDKDKEFRWLGEMGKAVLWGQHLCKGKDGKRIVVTEGEIDCLTVSQCFNNNWDVVSLPNGAANGRKFIERSIEFLEGYDTVVLWFDDDDAGRDATAACAPLFTPGRCKIAVSPGKDANEVMQGPGGSKAVTQAVYDAKPYRPDGVVTLGDIRSRVMAKPESGLPWFLPGLTKATYGRRKGELIGLGAGTGTGKTDFILQSIAFDVMDLGLTVGALLLEQDVSETGKRVAGKMAGRNFHLEGDPWTQEELEETYDRLEATGRLHLYDNFGSADPDAIVAKIKFMVVALGCQVVYLDHLTALAAGANDERVALEKLMAELAGLAKAYGFVLIFVSHLATPEGTPHEEGGRVMIRHFKGSRSIGFWSHTMLGIERDQQDRTGKPSIARVLKTRYSGRGTGDMIGMGFSQDSGLIREVELVPDAMGGDDTDAAF